MVVPKEHVIPPESAPLRLDLYLCQHWPEQSRKLWQERIRQGSVLVNGRSATCALPMVPGLRISFSEAALEPVSLHPDAELAKSLDVLQETDGLVFINKPAGLPCHPNRVDTGGTLANALVARWPSSFAIQAAALQAGLLNRLDTGTSGIVFAASSLNAFSHWQGILARATIQKWYVVLCHGDLSQGLGQETVTEWPIAHSLDYVNRAVAVGSKGAMRHRGKPRPAHTEWQIIHSSPKASIALAKVAHAQFHQIRVHAAALGCPLIGDEVYGPEVRTSIGSIKPHHGLHALRVCLHFDDSCIDVQANLPADLIDAASAYGLEDLRTSNFFLTDSTGFGAIR